MADITIVNGVLGGTTLQHHGSHMAYFSGAGRRVARNVMCRLSRCGRPVPTHPCWCNVSAAKVGPAMPGISPDDTGYMAHRSGEIITTSLFSRTLESWWMLGKSSQMAELFRLVKYYNLPYIYIVYYIVSIVVLSLLLIVIINNNI